MKTMLHPSHARSSRIAIAALLACTAISFFAGFYFADWREESDTNLITAAAFVLFGSAALLLTILRAFICRCASCGSWLTRQVKMDAASRSRKFICTKCAIVWDSEVELSTGGD